MDNPQLFIDDEAEAGDGAEANDIVQGSLGDCFFLSSAAILASATGHDLIKKLFVNTQYFDQVGKISCMHSCVH